MHTVEENSIDMGPDRSNPNALKQLASLIELRCVECASLYPGISAQTRYRCDCGGVLDVDAKMYHPFKQESALQKEFGTRTNSASEIKPLGAYWRQLFGERALQSPTWLINVDGQLPNTSGVWRYRELILPIPEQYIVSRLKEIRVYILLAQKIVAIIVPGTGALATMQDWTTSF